MVAALDLGSSAERRVGSSPSVRTNKKVKTALGGRWSQKAVFLIVQASKNGLRKDKNGLPVLSGLATCNCFIIFALVFVRSWKQDVSEITGKTALLILLLKATGCWFFIQMLV